MKREKGKIIFDNVEEMKWYYHARLCKNSADENGIFITRMYELSNGKMTPEEANKHLKITRESCEVKV